MTTTTTTTTNEEVSKKRDQRCNSFFFAFEASKHYLLIPIYGVHSLDRVIFVPLHNPSKHPEHLFIISQDSVQ